MERTDLEKCLADLRATVIKGAKPTRQRRMRGVVGRLQGGIAVSGQSQTALSPVPKVERNKEDQPAAEAEESSMSLNEAIGRFRDMAEGKTAKKPGDPGTDKAQSKVNKKQWAVWAKDPEKKKKYTGDTPMPSHKGEDVDFDRPPVESIFTEQSRRLSENDERDRAFAKSMLLDRVGLHHSIRTQLGLAEADDDDETPVSGARLAHNMTGEVQAEANIAVKAGASKSRFRAAYPGPQLPPEESEARAGVSGPGYAKDGREQVDVRMEAEHPMSTGAFNSGNIGDPSGPAPLSEGEVDVDSRDLGFDPTKIGYPKDLIGR